MKVHKVISRFATDSSDPIELRRVARALGSELPNKRVNVLREFRAQLACVPIGSDEIVDADEVSFATGYVAGLSDLSAEYEVAVDSADELSDEVARGIQIAVELFRHMVSSPFTSDASLRSVATGILGDADAAEQAVTFWQERTHESGLIGTVGADTAPTVESVPTLEIPPVLAPRDILWDAAHSESDQPSPRSAMRATTEPAYDEDSEPSRPIPISG